MAQIVITERGELKSIIKEVWSEINVETARARDKAAQADKLYTINQVRKRLGKAHNTIKNLVTKGLIKTTVDGLISEASINEYLQKN